MRGVLFLAAPRVGGLIFEGYVVDVEVGADGADVGLAASGGEHHEEMGGGGVGAVPAFFYDSADLAFGVEGAVAFFGRNEVHVGLEVGFV